MLHVVCQWIKMISEKIERHNHHRLCGHDGKGNITIDKIFCWDGCDHFTQTIYQFNEC